MPRIMTMNHQSVATAPLDLRTSNRERGSAGSRTPDCKGHAEDARGKDASPPCTGQDRPETHCPAVRSAPGPENGAARKRPADKSSYRLPFRKRPIPVEPESHAQSPVLPESGDRLAPPVDADFTWRQSSAGRLETTASESRVAAAPATLRRAEEAGQSPDGYPVRFLHPFDYGPYPVCCLPPAPELNHPLTHHAESLRTGIALATRQDEDGDTALHIAVVQEELALVRKLIQLLLWARRGLDIYNNLRQTPLHLAVITQQANMVEALLRDGADPAALDRNGQTALHLCCEYDQRDCLSFVLSHSQSSMCLEIRNYEGLSPLHLTVLRGQKDLARMLLDAGADINAMDIKSGQSPLMHAVESNKADMVNFLIEVMRVCGQRGCDVNSQSYSGNTALHSACGRGQVDTVRLLLKSGADSSLKNYHNDTPVMVAKNKKIADVLRGRGSNQICVSVSPHGSSFTENGSPSPNHSRGCSPLTTPHTPHHSASHSPKAPSTLVFPFY
ncbi:B-cell lymphoma 3 protein homolog isoform X2 [Cyclopterus lumpus]|uniref:B-cell lymphoma 3 protein homolog isoform X2 n=1 Tax=Cyclopterus lumpus TaxID=8103 RepID=UPI001486DBC4|nr:B-cell lymphoma 3 protein homolog isoform X2 [Cyclopterus lumpus]